MTAPIKSRLKSGNMRNADARWDAFTPDAYKGLHYSKIRPDDRAILELVRDFFTQADIQPGAHGIDAGSGPNLYPALSMLPFCSEITMLDISRSNVDWLQRQRLKPDRSWQQFWDVLTYETVYQELGDYKRRLLHNTVVKRGSLFDLPSCRYHVGTMFFVAESLSNDFAEFLHAVKSFIGSLRRSAPFAIAFMRGSEGYTVETVDFPAVAIDDVDVKNCLEEVAAQINSVVDIAKMHEFRKGFDGMLLATGRAALG
ncbi:hypothetical protein Rhe02_53540 [Rhizocola hellebori]|uniref:NNMT/PNMT/TEMT family protein n=1 Tax=Rhizocola hellebori TaxID=1392758 RepID=A0A8J3VIE0_9ACTN|nr:SCO2525 family SAM-dependent methyltransferase [Rhizocola hellebori]GIH07287.1 hypothetical protein Rhe02_53540 [Rhizocola hellebori]